ncbi:MAG: excinuclease ABC subunit UvrB [Abditibacteriota bacterium]|nr:excinuclease ABC subunit UvrB [Abditibacteriota bacterium]
MRQFQLVSDYRPAGSQPEAIESIAGGLERGLKYQNILGVTGSGKTYTMAAIIERLQRPALVIAHNKTLAAQLCSEFREFFPNNAVEYFVSYYDYYMPESYIPETDLYLEKDSSVNAEIDRLRHSATRAVLERRDTIIVASVSCIYGIGPKETYLATSIELKVGDVIDLDGFIKDLVGIDFKRNDFALDRGMFRIRGDIIEVQPIDSDFIIRIFLFGDEVENIYIVNFLTGEILEKRDAVHIFPATHFVTTEANIDRALKEIQDELDERVEYFRSRDMLVEAQRIHQRTTFDMEMIRELGYCSGIENYSRIMDGRAPGSTPHCLIEYFPEDFIMFVDESHQSIPQLRAMYNGDRSRKVNLVDYGFRLPSALDNRPLKFDEFEKLVHQVVWVSATPGPYEKELTENTAELVIRPTGLLDPEVIVRPSEGQIDDLIGEISQRAARGERTLVTTLTKKMAESLSEYLKELDIKVQYLHSEIKTIERTEILRDLRLGVYDVLVGINLLREGLDLPEVSLVAILDADKEGFLRSETSLVQTIGRAARHERGTVIMYADTVTESMEKAIGETRRRRELQKEYNRVHGITPHTVRKDVRNMIEGLSGGGNGNSPEGAPELIDVENLDQYLKQLERDMKAAAKDLNFEEAADIRDRIKEIKRLKLL